jgi:lysophospholipase L1-like esterase
MLKADHATSSFEVLNLGVPGTNSSRLRSQTGRIIETFRPDTLLVMVGANDFWTVPVPVADETTTWRQRLWAHSRVYRLFYMVRRSFERNDVEVIVETPRDGQPRGLVRHGSTQIDLSWTAETKNDGTWPQKLIDNIEAMAEAARQNGVRLVLLTYPSDADVYGRANRIVRTAAAQGIPLIDLGSTFRSACPGRSCPELFLPDHHPTMHGYQVAAALVWRRIREIYGLASAGEKPPIPAHLRALTARYLSRIDEQQAVRAGTWPGERRVAPGAIQRVSP